MEEIDEETFLNVRWIISDNIESLLGYPIWRELMDELWGVVSADIMGIKIDFYWNINLVE